MDSKRKLVARKLCNAKPTRSSWPLKQGRMGDLSQLKEDLEPKITTWQKEVDLKLMKSVWCAHLRTSEEDDLSEERVCEPLERAYVAIVHWRWLNETYYMPPRVEGYYQGRRVGEGSPPDVYYSGGKQLIL